MLKYLAFVKTVETGSFTRAAQALSYAQSSSSKMVADLEQEWGMTLLERSKSVVCLTSAGAQVLPFLRRLSAAIPGTDSFLRGCFCMELFCERGLLQRKTDSEHMTLCLSPGQEKVDLERSVYWQALVDNIKGK